MAVKEPFPLRKPLRALLVLVLTAVLFLPSGIPGGTAAAAKAKSGSQKQPPAENAVTVNEISFHMAEAKEVLQLTMNRFYVPEISRIEGDNPRVILDLYPVVHFSQKDYGKIAVNGRYIKQLRSYHDRKGKKLRIVLDMNGARNYFAQPSFVKSTNLFLLEITETASKK